MTYKATNTKGIDYYLHKTQSPNGHDLFYFSKTVNEDKAIGYIPNGRFVSETKNGLPVLKKGGI